MVTRPVHLQAYEFVVVSSLRAHQLMGGCVPKLSGAHKAITMAQMEVAQGCIAREGAPLSGDGGSEEPSDDDHKAE